jgi:hypothetical protein
MGWTHLLACCGLPPATHHSKTSPQFAEEFRGKTPIYLDGYPANG